MNFKRKLIALLLAGIYIIAGMALPYAEMLPVMSVAAAEETTVVTVTGSVVNIRAGAGTNFGTITTAQKGSTYVVLGSARDGDGVVWYKIDIGDKIGYIISTYCKVSTVTKATSTTTTKSTTTKSTTTKSTTTKSTTKSTTTKSTTTKSTTTKSTTASTTASTAPLPDPGVAANGDFIKIIDAAVNVRAGSGVSKNRIAVVSKDETYKVESTVTGDDGEKWYKITVDGKTGYISAANAALYEKAQGTSSITIEINGSVVNMRARAGSDSARVGIVRNGEIYNVLGSDRDSSGVLWYRVNINGIGGYISSRYVTANSTASTAPSTTTTIIPTTTTTKAPGTGSSVREVKTGVVDTTSTSLNVRKGAGTSYAVIGHLRDGETVVITGSSNGWYKIEFKDTTGYVKADYITNVKTETVLVKLAFGTDYYYVNAGKTVKVSANASGYTVTYSSSDPTNAPVDASTGVVSGKTPGMYTITAKTGNLSATTEVVVLKAPYTGIQHMTISEKGTSFIAQWEGGGHYDASVDDIIFEPYKDVAGFWTVGYGHAKTTTASKSWSRERAIAEFNIDISSMIGEEYIMTDEKPYLTQAEAQMLLNADLNNGVYVKAVSNWAVRNGVKLSQQQFDALVSFCFNLGASYWNSDTNMFYLKSAILCQRSGDDANDAQIVEGFTRYIKAGGVNYRGLWWRRRNEAEMFNEGDYAIDRENKFKLPDLVWGG